MRPVGAPVGRMNCKSVEIIGSRHMRICARRCLRACHYVSRDAVMARPIKRIRRVRKLPKDPSESRKQLRKWVNPTSKGDNGWSERVADVFGFSASESVHHAMRAMLELRHRYIHDHLQTIKRETVIDELSSWVYGSTLLKTLAARAVSAR